MLNNTLYFGQAGPKGTEIGTLEVGTLVKINENGAPIEYTIVNQGLPSSMYDASCDGCWVLRKDIAESRTWDGSSNDYKNSDIHAYLNGSWTSRYSAGVLSQIKQVKIPYRKGSGTSKTVTSGANGLSAKIFLLSSTEVSFNHNYMPTNEGAELSYFAGCADSGSDNKRVAYLNSSATDWWLRSPYTDDYYADFALNVDTNGYWNSIICAYSYGVRPALVLPSTALVDQDLNLIET